MSPSINSMFSAPGSEAEEDFDIDMDKLLEGVDASLAESTRMREPAVTSQDPPEPADEPEPDEPELDDPGVEPEPEPSSGEQTRVEEEPQGVSVPTASADPLGLLIQEAVADPKRRDRVLAALRQEAEQPEVVTPSLPDDIEEGSVAARLWHEAQENKRLLGELAQSQRTQSETMARQNAAAAADTAGKEFAAKYPQLDNTEVIAIAQIAGGSGLAAKLADGADDLKGAYVQALESTLWTNESFRAKVMIPPEPSEPSVAETDAAESKPRKRKLTALSSAASPSSAPATPRSPLETRADGKLTPQSRLSVVGELASKLSRDRNEGMY